MSSPFAPKTPAANRNPLRYKPLNSSPLGPMSSPVAAAQARRKSQYKSHQNSTPAMRRTSSSAQASTRSLFGHMAVDSSVENSPQNSVLRDRLKARCLERAVKAREKAIHDRRRGNLMSDPNSDDQPMDYDDDDDDEDPMQDELLRRIMANANRKQAHSYRVSYAQDVGSSFDPDMEDVGTWERELKEPDLPEGVPSASTSQDATTSEYDWLEEQISQEPIDPADLDDEELEAYAEECARQAAMEDFAGIPAEDLFSWSDDETDTPRQSDIPREDTNMDMS